MGAANAQDLIRRRSSAMDCLVQVRLVTAEHGVKENSVTDAQVAAAAPLRDGADSFDETRFCIGF